MVSPGFGRQSAQEPCNPDPTDPASADVAALSSSAYAPRGLAHKANANAATNTNTVMDEAMILFASAMQTPAFAVVSRIRANRLWMAVRHALRSRDDSPGALSHINSS